MNDNTQISFEAIRAMDKLAFDLRRKIKDRCRVLAEKHGTSIDKALVDLAYQAVIKEISEDPNLNVHRPAA
jgi:hypothetical protein